MFLLDDADVARARAWVSRAARFAPEAARRFASRFAQLTRRIPRLALPPRFASAHKWTAVVGAGVFALVSVADANVHFGQPGPGLAFVNPVLQLDWQFRLVNTYHLFASITRERIEPEFQTLAEGPVEERQADDAAWTAQHFRHKPGDLDRAPDFVAPHQPRVDFRLWFYGLAFQRRPPDYVHALIERLCEEPQLVQALFRAPLPAHPAAVRLVFWQYQFTSPEEKRATGAWWHRTRLGTMRAIPCPQIP